jgi:hypothetical protein
MRDAWELQAFIHGKTRDLNLMNQNVHVKVTITGNYSDI